MPLCKIPQNIANFSSKAAKSGKYFLTDEKAEGFFVKMTQSLGIKSDTLKNHTQKIAKYKVSLSEILRQSREESHENLS